MKILFVCTGNTCRSSMAKLITENLLYKLGQADKASIISRGTMAWPGQKANPKAVLVMKNRGLDLTSHQAALLSQEDINEADFIFAMTESHKSQILAMTPEAEGKITVLGISDPFGGDEGEYEMCAKELTEHLEQFLLNFFGK